MKRFILFWIIALSIGGCRQTKEDKEIILVVKNGFPLTYQVINKNAKDKWGTNEKRIKLTISDQCECFVLVGNMLINSEKYCNVDKRAFGTFFILATLENTKIKNLTPDKIFECIACNSFDERFSCMDLDWHGVLKSLIKQIIEYKKIEEEKNKDRNTVLV